MSENKIMSEDMNKSIQFINEEIDMERSMYNYGSIAKEIRKLFIKNNKEQVINFIIADEDRIRGCLSVYAKNRSVSQLIDLVQGYMDKYDVDDPTITIDGDPDQYEAEKSLEEIMELPDEKTLASGSNYTVISAIEDQFNEKRNSSSTFSETEAKKKYEDKRDILFKIFEEFDISYLAGVALDDSDFLCFIRQEHTEFYERTFGLIMLTRILLEDPDFYSSLPSSIKQKALEEIKSDDVDEDDIDEQQIKRKIYDLRLERKVNYDLEVINYDNKLPVVKKHIGVIEEDRTETVEKVDSFLENYLNIGT